MNSGTRQNQQHLKVVGSQNNLKANQASEKKFKSSKIT